MRRCWRMRNIVSVCRRLPHKNLCEEWNRRVEGSPLRVGATICGSQASVQRGFDHAGDTKNVGARFGGGSLELLSTFASQLPCVEHPSMFVLQPSFILQHLIRTHHVPYTPVQQVDDPNISCVPEASTPFPPPLPPQLPIVMLLHINKMAPKCLGRPTQTCLPLQCPNASPLMQGSLGRATQTLLLLSLPLTSMSVKGTQACQMLKARKGLVILLFLAKSMNPCIMHMRRLG